MARVITLADFRPSARADESPWVKARVEEADSPTSKWTEAKAISLDPVDGDPKEPQLRSFTVAVAKDWARLVFLDGEEGEDQPSPFVYVPGPAFRPTADEVAAILRARTYTGSGEEGDFMSMLVGGELAGEFNDETRPTGESVEDVLIPQACVDVRRAVGTVPGVLLGDARRVAAMRTAAEIERSYIPAEAEGGIYQTLRLTFQEQAEELRRRLQWWALTESLEGEE